MTFSVRLPRASNKTVNVNNATRDETAKAFYDYFPTQGTLTLPAEMIRRTIIVEHPAGSDLTETFFVDLTNLANATLVDNQASGRILDR